MSLIGEDIISSLRDAVCSLCDAGRVPASASCVLDGKTSLLPSAFIVVLVSNRWANVSRLSAVLLV